MKFGPIRPARTTLKFDYADFLENFAEVNGVQVRGQMFVWHNELPQWLVTGKYSRDELTAIMRKQIATVVGRYCGHVYAWDVVNEAVDDQTAL